MKKTKVLFMGLLLCMAQPMWSQGFGNLLNGVITAVKETKKKSQKGNATTSETNVNTEVTNQEEQVINQEAQVTKADDDIILVVSAVGTTTEEATKTALRSAIEQAYGTFVSANTTILNDELVKGEIVTIAKGNIKNYKEIANAILADGRVSVTLQAMVSISNLVSYAQSKGASTEFAGAVFAMNMKMKELNKKNEMAALENLLVQVKQMLPYAFTRKLVINTPREPFLIKESEQYVAHILNSIAVNNGADVNKVGGIVYDFGLFNKGIEEVLKLGGDPTKKAYQLIKNASSYYEMPSEVVLEENENTQSFFQLIINTLESLALTQEEMAEMKQQNIEYSEEKQLVFDVSKPSKVKKFYFRNSDKDINDWRVRLRAAILNELSDFVMVDNLGGKSYFKDNGMLSFIEENSGYKTNYNFTGRAAKYCTWNSVKMHVTNGYGLFSPIVLFDYSHISYWPEDLLSFTQDKLKGAKLKLLFSFFIPKDKIMEYNNFILERKTN